jgi:hypothetical protein
LDEAQRTSALDPFRRFGPAYETEPPIDGDYGLFRKTSGWKWVIQPLLTVERTVERAPGCWPLSSPCRRRRWPQARLYKGQASPAMIATGGPMGCGSRPWARAKPLAARYITHSKFNRARLCDTPHPRPARPSYISVLRGSLSRACGDAQGGSSHRSLERHALVRPFRKGQRVRRRPPHRAGRCQSVSRSPSSVKSARLLFE